MASEVVRIDAALVEAARTIGSTMGRSVAAQLSHWAKLGRAVEGADISTSEVHELLVRQDEFDALQPEEQAAVTRLWDQRMAEAIEGLDLVADFESVNESYAELDDDGNLVEHRPKASAAAPEARAKRRLDVQSPRLKGRSIRTELDPDPIYGSLLVTQFINKVSNPAVVYASLDIVKATVGTDDPLVALRSAVDAVRPRVELRPRRVNGTVRRVPVRVLPRRANTLAVRWLVDAARMRTEPTLAQRLAGELLDAGDGAGAAVQRRQALDQLLNSRAALARDRS